MKYNTLLFLSNCSFVEQKHGLYFWFSMIDFIIEPTLRFQGEIGEQRTMFFRDPSGNAIEIKAFKDMENLFSS